MGQTLRGRGGSNVSLLPDLVRAGSPDPAVRPTGGFQVTRRRSGTRSARVSWTRHSAERRSPRDAPTVGGWESCGHRGRGVRRPLPEPATDRDCSSSMTSVSHRGPPSMTRRVGYGIPHPAGVNMLRHATFSGFGRNLASLVFCVSYYSILTYDYFSLDSRRDCLIPASWADRQVDS